MNLNFGTLNVRGCKTDYTKNILIKDAKTYNIDILAISETHILGDGLEQHGEYILYHVGSSKHTHHGTGIIIKKELKPSFKKISDRICQANIKLKHCRLVIISVYAPTLEVSEKKPELREEFYAQLHATLKNISKRDLLVLMGDFNAKTGSGRHLFPNNIGHYGKGELNNNGIALLECLSKHDLILTNTLFQHKLAHRTTWTGRKRNQLSFDGKPRRNHYYNQIDYIIVKNEHRCFIQNSRSHGGCLTDTDHKMVKMTSTIKWYKMKEEKIKRTNIDVQKFADKNRQEEYKEKTAEIFQQQKQKNHSTDTKNTWSNIVTTCKQAGKEILGTKSHTKKSENDEIIKLSKENQKIKLDIETAKDPTKVKSLQSERRINRKKINKILKKEEEEKLNHKLSEIEKHKDDSTKCHLAMRASQALNKKPSLIVHDQDQNVAGTPEEQAKIIRQHFVNMLAPENNKDCKKHYQPTKMRIPFTKEEIGKATRSMKNGKSAGIDDLNAEFIKYATADIHEEIANIYNTIAETGEFPEELITGILTPLPKPGKKKGPPENLRPIILLSVLRKILAICLIRRTWEKLSSRIPLEQAAYQPGRSTTEQVLAVKLLAEKAIISQNYEIYLLLLDMSKAFDTVNRKILFEKLELVLDPDELHLLDVLVNDVKIRVRVEDKLSQEIITNTGIAQGDCLSAVLFIYYLAAALTPEAPPLLEDHNYALPSEAEIRPDHLKDHKYYVLKQDHIEIAPKYADDITWITTARQKIEQVKETVPSKLKAYNLQINETKTEEYNIPNKQNSTPWQECKLLGSLIETVNDINRRKALTISVMKKYNYIFKSRRISNDYKIRVFKSYAGSVFLYNSEIWSLTSTLEKKIDAFQRRQLRFAINNIWPRKLSNEQLYKLTNTEAWSITIKRRRLNWIGHMMRLHPETPVRIALKEHLRYTKRKKGRPTNTWVQTVTKDLKNINKIRSRDPIGIFKELEKLCADRRQWRDIVRHAMSEVSDAQRT